MSMESATYTVLADGTHTDSTTGIRRRVYAGDVITMQLAVNLGLAGAALGVVATSGGTGTGAVPDEGFYAVTSGNADHIVSLPNAPVGAVVALRNGATGYELRTHDPATVAINGGSGASAESAIPAATLVVCMRDTATSWLCTNTATDGSVTTTDPAA
jgi:hypothetical protein